MDRRPTETLDKVVAAFLRQSGCETPLLHHRLLQLWPQIVGEPMAPHTEALHIKEQALWIKVHSPALRSQLLMMRQQLVRKLNEAVGCTLIYDLRIV